MLPSKMLRNPLIIYLNFRNYNIFSNNDIEIMRDIE